MKWQFRWETLSHSQREALREAIQSEEIQEALAEREFDPDYPMPVTWPKFYEQHGTCPELDPAPRIAVDVWLEHGALGESTESILARMDLGTALTDRIRRLILVAEGAKSAETKRRTDEAAAKAQAKSAKKR